MDFGENRKDKTYAFLTFSPFKSWWSSFEEIGVMLGAWAPSIQKAARALNFLHYAYFIRVTPKSLERAGLAATPPLKNGGFLFLSAYNGDAEVYFRGFSDGVAGPMNQLWSRCVDWVNANPYENLERFILRYNRHVDAHYNSYPSAVTRVRAALLLRGDVDRLLRSAYSAPDDAAFAKEYADVVMATWGNGDAEAGRS